MRPRELKVARIGNSKGVRIPADTLERYHIGATVVMEERSDGILLRPTGPADPKLSWEDTACQMAQDAEDWSVWEVTVADGLEDIPWEKTQPRRVAEGKARYTARKRSRPE